MKEVTGNCQGMTLSWEELRLHNPGIEGTGGKQILSKFFSQSRSPWVSGATVRPGDS